MKLKLFLIGFVLFQIATLNLKAQIVFTKNDTINLTQDSLILRVGNHHGNVLWQYSKESEDWIDVPGETKDSLLFLSIDSSGYYRAKIVDGTCKPVYSDTAIIIAVNPELALIDLRPDSVGWDYWIVAKDGSNFYAKVNDQKPVSVYFQPNIDMNGYSIFFGDNGLPTKMVVDSTIYLFDNYRDGLFDIALILPNGYTQVFRDIQNNIDLTLFTLNSLKSSQTNDWLIYAVKTTSQLISVVSCVSGLLALPTGVGTIPGAALVIAGCGATVIGMVADVLLEDSNFMGLGISNSLGIINLLSCSGGDPLACAKATLFLEKKALEISDNEKVTTVQDLLQLPSISTSAITNITQNTATGGGNVISIGSSPVTFYGICWSTTTNPTSANNNSTINGTGTGSFTSNLTGLTANTPYYVRAYATNSQGTAYGSQVTFTTGQTVTQPTVTTTAITAITQTTATSGGNITADGGAAVTARGICWNTAPNPTTANNPTINGTGSGSFTSTLTGLAANTPYYVRAYATNSQGTAYGNEVTFTTSSDGNLTGSFTDPRDGHVYRTVTIGEQVWMTENLAYLPVVHSPTSESITEPRYYVYGYTGSNIVTAKQQINYTTYGVLYNWPAALIACPPGWHLPCDDEWTDFTTFLGGESVAGGKMKETGTAHWLSPNTSATNESGFSALPGGFEWGVTFYSIGIVGYWWSSTEDSIYGAWVRSLSDNNSIIYREGTYKETGLSVRCVRDNTTAQLPSVTTSTINSITQTTATSGGNITADGGSAVTARGICWNTAPNPTTANSKTTNGTDTGSFTSNLTGLTENTPYYVRAYATNSQGTAYGNEITFTTSSNGNLSGTFTDSRDGHVYKTIKIGEQVWMAENLAYMPAVSPPTEGSYTEPLYYVYGYEGTNVAAAKATDNYATYGVLYNWPAAMASCPTGWHLPTDEEWIALKSYLIANGYNYDGTTTGNKIGKALAATTNWDTYSATGAIGDNLSLNNKSGFSALPSGYRNSYGFFYRIGNYGSWWSSTEDGTDDAWDRHLDYGYSSVGRGSGLSKGYGFSVRCVRD